MSEAINGIKLAPCPFCGGNAEIEESILCLRVACKSCKDAIGDNIQSCSCTEYFEKDKLNEAISAWNRRFTGMTDCHGIKIYTGDEIKAKHIARAEVIFHNGKFCANCNLARKTIPVPLADLMDREVIK